MQTQALRILTSALFAISAFFFINGPLLAAGTDVVDQPVTINAIVGQVEVLTKGAVIWEPAEVGTKLIQGSSIRTAEGAKAELILEDGSYIRLKEKTTLNIKVAQKNPSSQASAHNLELRIGEIMLDLQKLSPDSSFAVETPTAVAAVRGTTYYVRTGTRIIDGVEKSFVEIFVDSGLVEYSSLVSGLEMAVPAGLGAIVYDDGTVEGPYPIPPTAQDAWRSGYDMKYDDSAQKKGMRDADEQGAGDSGQDIDDTATGLDQSQNNANLDRNNEQQLYGLGKVKVIVDTDNDGLPDDEDTDDDNDHYSDSDELDNSTDPLDAVSVPADNDSDYLSDLNDPDDDNDNLNDPDDRFPLDYFEQSDSDNDVPDYWQLSGRGEAAANAFMPVELYPGDDEDAFANDPQIDGNGIYIDEFGLPFYGWLVDSNQDGQNDTAVRGYGSQYELRQAALNNLKAINNLKQDVMNDINDLMDDIRTRQFEAFKEKVFDAQAHKVMTDYWGNRVRVEEYVFKQPTDGLVDTVQILSLNLRTAGPNAGISSLDFQVRFDQDIANAQLSSLPWNDYMCNPRFQDLNWYGGYPQPETDPQLIVYNNDTLGAYNPQGSYPLPLEFSLEAKNPYGDFVKFTESYSQLLSGLIYNQYEQRETIWYQQEESANTYINSATPKQIASSEESWSPEGNRFDFTETYTDDSWLSGVLYLINDDGSLIEAAGEVDERDYLNEVNGIRDCINPDFNLEMVLLSSEFAGNDQPVNSGLGVDNARSIDVITIPEITWPYRRK